MKIELDQTKLIKPCPNCKSYNISFVCEHRYGHGDSTFEHGRIMCLDCTLAYGNESNWGKPDNKDVDKTLQNWNNLKR